MNRKVTTQETIKTLQGDERKSLFEYIFGFTVFLIGAGIMVYVFAVNPQQDIAKESYDLGNNESYVSKPTSNLGTRKVKRHNWITYSGDLESWATIRFRLKGYDKNVKYVFDFGDGVQKDCKRNHIEYYYTKPGRYTVKVKMFANGQETEAWSETLKIGEGIYVDPAAYN